MGIKRLPKHPPYQTEISVSDAVTFDGPVGVSHENEEMRRIQLGVEDLEDRIVAAGVPLKTEPNVPSNINQSITNINKGGDTNTTIINEGGLWALTVKHNDSVMPNKRDVQILNFRDGPGGMPTAAWDNRFNYNTKCYSTEYKRIYIYSTSM
jgi:hypothetical protein